KLHFSDRPEASITDFLDKLAALFTLNRDLLVARLYKADNISILLHPNAWHMPGMVPITEPVGTEIKDVKEWRALAGPAFAVEPGWQPYFKLHGSSNWIDDSCPSPKPHPTRLTMADAVPVGPGTPGDCRQRVGRRAASRFEPIGIRERKRRSSRWGRRAACGRTGPIVANRFSWIRPPGGRREG